MRLGEFRTRTRDLDNKLILKIANYSIEGISISDVDWDMCADRELYLRIVPEKVSDRWDELLPNDKRNRFRFVQGSYQLDKSIGPVDTVYEYTRIYDNLEERFLSHDCHDMDYVVGMLNKLWVMYLNTQNDRLWME